MTTSQLVRLLIACAVLLVLAGLVYFMKRPAGSGGGGGSSKASRVFADLDVNEIQGLRIGTGEQQTEIVRKEDGVWAVSNRGDYPANDKEIKEFVVQLRNLEKQQSMSVPDAELGRFGLATSEDGENAEDGEDQPLQVELLKGDGSVLETFLLGGSRQSGDSKQGRYVRVGDGKVHLVSERFSGLKPEAGEWLSKDFFKVEKIKSVSLVDPNPAESWKVDRADANGEFSLADAKPDESADPAKTSSFKWMMGSPSFDDVLTAEDAKKINFGMGAYGAEITTFDGFKYVMSIAKVTPKAEEGAEDGAKAPDPEYYLKVDVTGSLPEKRAPGADEDEETAKALDEQWAAEQDTLKKKLAQEQKLSGRVYRIAEYTVSSLLKKRSDILKVDETSVPGVPGAGNTGNAPGAPGARPGALRPQVVTPPVEMKIPAAPGNPVAPKPAPKPEMNAPTKPEPTKPEPTKPEPTKPEPAKPEPATPKPATPKPAKPGMAKPKATPQNTEKGSTEKAHPKPEPEPEVAKPQMNKPESAPPNAVEGANGAAKGKSQPQNAGKGKDTGSQKPAKPAMPKEKPAPAPAEKPAESTSESELLKALEDLEETLEESKKP